MRLISLALLGMALRADVQLEGPVLGWALDMRLQQLRPLQGVAGSATIGMPLNLGFQISQASISPRQDTALIVRASDGAVVLVNLKTGQSQTMDGLPGSPVGFAYSPAGTAAIVTSSTSAVVWVITGLPDSPQLAARDLSAFGPAPLTAAVADDGLLLAVIGNGLLAVKPGGDPSLIPWDIAPDTMVFAGATHDAVLFGPGGLILVSDVAGGANRTVLMPPGDALWQAAGIGVTASGRVFLVDITGKILIADSTNGVIGLFDCGCRPSGTFAVNAAGVFRLTEISNRPIVMLDGSGSTPGILFVPPAADGGNAQ